MKKLLSIFLVIILSVSFSGCSLLDTITTPADKFTSGVNSTVNEVKGTIQFWLDDNNNQDTSSYLDSSTSESSDTIKVLNVGQGLSVLFESNGEYMLYDGGDRNASSYVVSYLKRHNISKIKYMVASHYDDDHINGLVGVLKNFDVENIIGPDYTTDTRVYKSFVSEISAQNKSVIHPYLGDAYTISNAKLTVLSPSKSYTTDDENDKSIVVKLQTASYTCLLTGDAGKDAENNMISNGVDLKSDILIVGHHGSSGSTTTEFLNKVNPSVALISVGKNNQYKHPSEKTLKRLTDKNIKIYRTDTDGELSVVNTGDDRKYDIVKS